MRFPYLAAHGTKGWAEVFVVMTCFLPLSSKILCEFPEVTVTVSMGLHKLCLLTVCVVDCVHDWKNWVRSTEDSIYCCQARDVF